MKMSEADLIWTPAKPYTADCPNPGAIRVERHGSGWERTSGDRWMPIHRSLVLGVFQQFETKDDRTRQLLSMFVLFNTVVVRDGIDPAAAHQAFLEIDEYRQHISPDTPGADR
jgi:hypothetical protein